MHNLHYVLTKADDAEDAGSQVEMAIEDFGNENNWRSIGGVISLDGTEEIHNLGDARWTLDDLNENEGNTPLEKAYSELGIVANSAKKKQQELAEQVKNLGSDEGSLWTLKRDIIALIEAHTFGKAQTMNEYAYDEFGITDMRYNDEDTRKEYLVMVDMHS